MEGRALEERAQQVGLIGLGAAAIVLLFGNLIGNDPGEEGGVVSFFVLLLVCAIVAAFLFLYLVPTAVGELRRPARTGLIVSGIGVVSVIAFWSGLPFLLGPAGALLGQLGLERRGEGEDRGQARIARALGVAAVVLATIAFLIDEISQ